MSDNEQLAEIKAGVKALNGKLDTYIGHQRELCELKHKEIAQHLKDSPHFRDKIVKLSIWVKANWAVTLLILAALLGCLGWFIKGGIQ